MRKVTRAVVASIDALLLIVLAGMVMPTTDSASASYSINKIQSGLVSSDSLTTGNTASWSFGGSATLYDYYENSEGLHLGIQSSESGQWVGYYASRSQPNANLFHAIVTIPDTVVPDGVSNVGLYVEGSDFVPHVGCEAYADWSGYYWVVEQSSDAGATYNILYISDTSSMPQIQDCTIITNGNNYLKVYIGGNVVFSSTTMNLGMTAPLIAYFQDDTSSSSSMHYATYRDYYATSSENIKVTNIPSGATTVKIIDSSGNVLSSSSVSSGISTLNISQYNFPLQATINVYDSGNSVMASSPASIFGGDIFSVDSSGPITAPQPPTGLTATASSASRINLSWNAPTDNGGSPIIGYKIERSTNGGSTWNTIVSNTGSTSTTYSNTGLVHSNTYTYKVSAINSVGTSTPSNTASATTFNVKPSPPSGLTATAASSSQINLSWNAPSDNGGATITGYKIQRSTNGGSTWNIIVSNTGSTSTTYSNTGLAASTTYTYRVFAINSVGTSSPSNTASANTFGSITIPQPPTGLTATAASSSQINLSWNAPSDNGGAAITGYKIEQSTDGGTTWSDIISNTGSTSTTYSNTGLAASTTYTYRISAINSAGTSNPSNSASATTSQQEPKSITLTTSGLVAFDPLNNETKTRQELEANQRYWHYGGSAFSYFNPPAPTDLFKDSQGLHLGVQTPTNGTYAGFYAVAEVPATAALFHAKITTPVRTISGDFFQNGLYIQTADGRINYVTCVSITSTAGTSWHIVRTYGNFDQATQFEVLWSDLSTNQPLTKDCTMIINGNNYLKVYLDGIKVYENNNLDLQMPAPYLYFLEPQNSHAQMLYGIYQDYYVTKGETIQITNTPVTASRVDVISSTGNVLSTSPVTSGTVILDVGKYNFPLDVNIKVYDSANNVIASTTNLVSMFGGDGYSVN